MHFAYTRMELGQQTITNTGTIATDQGTTRHHHSRAHVDAIHGIRHIHLENTISTDFPLKI